MRSAGFKALTCQVTASFIKGAVNRTSTTPRIAYDRLLGTGGYCFQSLYLSYLTNKSVLIWSGKGEKALWQN